VKRLAEASLLPLALLLGGCVVLPPSGPSMQALPGSKSSFQQFQVDDAACREYATAQSGGQPAAQAARESAASTAVAGTLIGAAIGAALGGSSDGTAVGAAFGLLTGAAVGTDAAQSSYYLIQRNYDGAYYACMYGRGHRVPVAASYAEAGRVRAQPQAAPMPPPPSVRPAVPSAAPPPDAGTPPPNTPPPNVLWPDAPPPAAPYVPPYWPNTAPRQ
jgi:hypothetical protein